MSAAVGAELATRATRLTPAACAAIAQRHYGLEGTAEFLWGEKDSNYRLSLADGRAYLLKVLNPGEDPATTRMHSAALLHVAQADPAVPVQRLHPTRDGAPDLRLTAEEGGVRAVRLVSFLPGMAQKAAPHSAAQRRAVGETLAALQSALAGFDHPAARNRITWDMSHAADLEDLLPVIADPGRRARLAALLAAFRTRILPVLGSLPAQVIHNDFNLENILVDPQAPARVSGIIDFGDMVHAPRLFDLAVAAAYQLGTDPADPLGAVCDLLEGYRRHLCPQQAEVALLWTAMRTRMAMRILLPEWRADLFPEERARLTRNSASVWQELSWLDRVSEAEATARFTAALQP
ncbi:phosphotransferase [Pseudooceanicola sp. CBS1P-1]|uniref:Hydroxylysine kinase n=1 Tax=Pseudooceanicola albus TaxID=2692189 RepID=A0A6L7G7P1_9RHOB|nr:MULTISPECIES: phosphotransferase [Pseudooceanicola]MBT9385962.1 phosphotransferase [Pseudooceanicola endophyticus]MXN19617.1 phosphotransferase [Pseudooceanicola albus]